MPNNFIHELKNADKQNKTIALLQSFNLSNHTSHELMFDCEG